MYKNVLINMGKVVREFNYNDSEPFPFVVKHEGEYYYFSNADHQARHMVWLHTSKMLEIV